MKLIDKYELEAKFHNECFMECSCCPHSMVNRINHIIGCALIKNAPIIDAVPVIHANWVPIDDEPYEEFECNRCGYISTTSFGPGGIEGNSFLYCPMCGAKMD